MKEQSINKLNKDFRVDASCDASTENEIDELIRFASIKIPNEYLVLIREQTELEINIRNQKYIRRNCIEL